MALSDSVLALFFKTMASLFDRISAVITKLAGYADENATLKEQLAEALANDAADADRIAAAEAAATEARAKADELVAKVNELQALADADAAEDQQISDLIAPFEDPAPEPAPEG